MAMPWPCIGGPQAGTWAKPHLCLAQTSVRELVKAKTCAFCPGNYGTRFVTNGSTWMEARAHKAVKQRDDAAAVLGDADFAGVPPPPPPMVTQV
jgi:hypothetical protein